MANLVGAVVVKIGDKEYTVREGAVKTLESVAKSNLFVDRNAPRQFTDEQLENAMNPPSRKAKAEKEKAEKEEAEK